MVQDGHTVQWEFSSRWKWDLRPVLRLKDLFTNCGNIHSVHSTPCGDLFLAKNTNSEGDYSIQPRAPKIFTKRLYF